MAHGYLEILNRLHDSGAEFVIVGGVAAALHGGSRVTFDLDLVPALEPRSWQLMVDLLWSLEARPRIPEPFDKVRDVDQVRRWREEKNMLALNFRSPDGMVEVDLLVSESDGLAGLRARATRVEMDDRSFFVASIDDLIAMKAQAGRPQDLLDIGELRAIQARAK
jgi:predicted nucleotidyltransferase